jgi:signal transduction histidine kinase
VNARKEATANTAELIEVFVKLVGQGSPDGAATGDGRILDVEPLNAVRDLAHDMRSPLTSILFLVDTILRGRSGPVTGDQERQLRLVYSAAWGLSALACDVIDATRGHRLLDGRPAPFSISEIIQSVCDIVRPIAEERGLAIEMHHPQRDARRGYSSAVARVLLNLATNALQHTTSGLISIGCVEQHGSRVLFWVEDTGCGIEPDGVDIKPAGASPNAGGFPYSTSGLGLVICRNLLEAMGTCLDVGHSKLGGAYISFEIDLPLV